MPDQSTTSVMQMIQNGLGNRVHIDIDSNDPKQGSAIINGLKVEINTRSDSFSLRFPSHMGTAVDKGKVVGAHNTIAKIFGAPEIKLNDVTVTGGGDSIVGSKMSADQLTATHAKQAEHQKAVHTTTQAVLRASVSDAQGMDRNLATAQMRHEVNQAIGVAPTHNPLTGAAPASPVMRAAQEGLSEFQRMLREEKPAVQKPVTATNPHPESELTMLLSKKPYVAQEATPSATPTNHTHTPAKSPAAGNFITKLLAGGAMAAGAGVAAAAQAPEGERLQAGLKATGKAAADNMLPGVTETDMCKKVGAATAAVGGAVGAVVGGGGAVAGTALTAAPTLGGSVAASPWTVAAGVALGGTGGAMLGDKLGEGACNLARNAIKAISGENRAQIQHKPTTETVASNKAPDTTRGAQTHGASAGRS